MGTITKAERQALDELFISMHEKRNVIEKLRTSRMELIKIFKTVLKPKLLSRNH